MYNDHNLVCVIQRLILRFLKYWIVRRSRCASFENDLSNANEIFRRITVAAKMKRLTIVVFLRLQIYTHRHRIHYVFLTHTNRHVLQALPTSPCLFRSSSISSSDMGVPARPLSPSASSLALGEGRSSCFLPGILIL